MSVVFPRLLRETQIRELAGYPIVEILTMDGHKFLLEDDQWVLLRFSGTEPLLRIFAEADSPAKARALVDAGQALLPM
jgi:phosphomannomutase